jgi:hypothetical protein
MEDRRWVSIAMSPMVMAEETHDLHDHGSAPWTRRPHGGCGSLTLETQGHGCGGWFSVAKEV